MKAKEVWALLLHPYSCCEIYRDSILEEEDIESCSGHPRKGKLYRAWKCEECPFYRSQDKWTSQTI